MSEIKNIIFDFGGVVIDIDYQRCIDAFLKLGFDNFGHHYSQMKQDSMFDDLETGKIPPRVFHDRIRKDFGKHLSDEVIDDAWNAILLRLRPEKVAQLQLLKNRYRLFLLSNTNVIHEKEFMKRIVEDYGRNILPEIFEGYYFSHLIGLRKPNAAVYEYVLKKNGLVASETLFVDDSFQHVEGAWKSGLHGYHYVNNVPLDKIL